MHAPFISWPSSSGKLRRSDAPSNSMPAGGGAAQKVDQSAARKMIHLRGLILRGAGRWGPPAMPSS